VGSQIALLPGYAAAGTAVLVLLVDLLIPGRRGPVIGVASVGALVTAGTAVGVGIAGGPYVAFCADGAGCSLVTDRAAVVVATLFALLTLGVLALSVPVLRTGEVPVGEYCFLLACSLTGGVVLGAARDLITLIVALETLTLPLYILVGLRRRALAGAEAAVTFFVVSVVSTAVSLLGAALLYAATGALHFGRLSSTLESSAVLRGEPLVSVGVVLLLAGLGFKVAAVPLHAWAPPTYDGAPLPVAAYLSTASKLGGVTAVVLVTLGGLGPVLAIAGPALAVLAVLTMTVGNLVALRQRRMVRLLAWSSIAQAGYILAPLGAFALVGGRSADAVPLVLAATVAYTVFYVVLEFGAFAAVVALRGDADGGALADYRGVARRSPWIAAFLVLALAGLAGLPPGLAGLFAKVAVVRALLGGESAWLAVVVALNAVVGLAYYVRAAAVLFAAPVDAGVTVLTPATDAGPASGAGPASEVVPATVAGPASEVAPATVAAANVAAPANQPGSASVAAANVAVPANQPGSASVAAANVAAPASQAGSASVAAATGAALAALTAGEGERHDMRRAVPWAVGAALVIATGTALVVGFMPQWVMDVAAYVRP
jgi:NADH-quinone oxidoreductase subunit N